MVFLFVGSSALTEASFPRDLAIPQLLLSSACAIVLTMKASPTAVFPHRGLAPHQFTPMSGARESLDSTGFCACVLPLDFSWLMVSPSVNQLVSHFARHERNPKNLRPSERQRCR